MNWNAWQTPHVGAPIGSINAGAGVDGIISLGKSKGMMSGLSNLSKGVVWSTSLALSQMAYGNHEAAIGIAAGTILTAAAYYTGAALSEGFQKAVTVTAAEAVSQVSQVLPILGQVVGSIVGAFAAYGTKPGQQDDAQRAEACRAIGWFVVPGVDGMGPQNQILPADLFMGPSHNDLGAQRPDAFTLFGTGPHPYNHTDLAELLIELEKPDPGGFPIAGLDMSSETRTILSQLRRGLSALYVNSLTGQHWTPGIETDGGSMLWVPYIDILNREWRKKRLSHKPLDVVRNDHYVRWRLLKLQSKYLTGELAKAPEYYAAGVINGVKDPAAFARSFYSTKAGLPCALYDSRASRKLALMVDGWEKLINSPFTQFKGYGSFPTWQAGDNPLHGPPNISKPGLQGDTSLLGTSLLVGGLAFAGLYAHNPALAKAYATKGAHMVRKGATAASTTVVKLAKRLKG